MKLLSLMATIGLVSCSQLSTKSSYKHVEVKVTQQDLQACKEYQKNVLDKAYKIDQKTKSPFFTTDMKEARDVMASFDVNKGLVTSKANMVNNILHSCDAESIKKFDQDYKSIASCNLMFSELNYFQSLSQALKHYPWPTDLKLEGKKLALDYVRFFSEGSFPLLNRLIALSVLDELSVNEVVNKDLHSDIRQLMQESRTYVESLRTKLNKDPSLTCESLGIIGDELNYSNKVAEKLKGFLKRI